MFSDLRRKSPAVLPMLASGRLGRPYIGLIEINSTGHQDPAQAGAAPARPPDFSLSAGQLANMLDAFASKAGSLEMIYFTGADPAGHPQLGPFIEMAYEKGGSRIGLQCDGLRIARDDDFLAMLARLKPVIFLEFDGFDETTSLILHGRRDLPFEAMRALDRLAGAGLPVALLTTVALGANLQEIGAIAAYGFKHPAVFCALFRPIPPHQNRLLVPTAGQANAAGQLSAARIIDSLDRQSQGLLDQVDFAPAFCCRPTRHFVAELPAVPEAGCRREQATATVPGNSCQPCGAPVTSMTNGQSPPGAALAKDWASGFGLENFWLGVHDFMTPWCYDAQKARNCPLIVIMPDGRTIPYCLFNAFGAASYRP